MPKVVEAVVGSAPSISKADAGSEVSYFVFLYYG